MLLDSASLYFRAFYGVPDQRESPAEAPTNAVRGFLDMIATLVDRHRPDHLVACWDNDWRPAFRVEAIPSYKTHRVADETTDPDAEEVPDALAVQVPVIISALEALGICRIGVDGYEADDVIGALTIRHRGRGPVDIVTGDRDLFQLVDDDRSVRVLYVGRGVANHDRVDADWLRAKYGIDGAGYVDFAVLRGDPSDGLPGVAGIGEKTAARLVADHRDLAGIMAAATSGRLSPTLTARLAAAVGYLGPAQEVVAVRTDVPLPPLDLTLPRTPADPQRFADLADLLGLGGSAERIVAALARG